MIRIHPIAWNGDGSPREYRPGVDALCLYAVVYRQTADQSSYHADVCRCLSAEDVRAAIEAIAGEESIIWAVVYAHVLPGAQVVVDQVMSPDSAEVICSSRATDAQAAHAVRLIHHCWSEETLVNWGERRRTRVPLTWTDIKIHDN